MVITVNHILFGLKEKRLRARQTESEEHIQKRLKTAEEEMKYGDLMHHHTAT